jgi:NAD(P)-dependent dehydrogenase (short-subunit alcohol dehydrogenase family)
MATQDFHRWALVTGSARRIGRVIALDLAAHGWDIVVHYYRSTDEAQSLATEIQELGRSACCAEIDLANPELAENLIPSLAEEIGMIDALVNNAALFEHDETDPGGERHFAVNADAPRLLSKAFRDHLPPGEKGAIVNILDSALLGNKSADEAALDKPGSLTHFEGYNASKRFLADLTRNMAKSFAPRVRVNGVAPGFILPSPGQSEESFARMAEGNRATPEQVAVAVRRFLETPTITGEIVNVPGSQ